MPFSRALASILLAGLITAHSDADAKGRPQTTVADAAQMERVLLKDNKKLRIRQNIVRVIEAWESARANAQTHEDKVKSLKGEARMWGVLAHWSGRAHDKQRAQEVERRAKRSAQRLASSKRKQKAIDVWLTKVVVEVSEEQFKLVFPISHEVTLERGALAAKKGSNQRRVYFDLHPLVASKQALGKIPIDHAGVRHARVGQLDSRTVRVVFDILQGEDAPKIEIAQGPETAIIVSTKSEHLPIADATELPGDDPLQDLIEKLAESVEEAEGKQAEPSEKPDHEETFALDKRIPLSPSTKAAIQPRKDEWLAGIKRVVIDPGHGGKDTGALGRRGTREKDINLAVALKLGKELEKQLGVKVVYTRKTDVFISLKKRAQIANSANADLFVSVHANAHKSSKVSGIETYYLNTTSSRYASRLARRENSESFDPKHVSSATPEADEVDDSGVLPPGALGRDLRLLLADLAMKSAADESRRLAGFVQSSAVGSLRRAYQSVKDLGVKRALFYVLLGVRMPSILVESGFVTNAAEEKRLRDPRYQTKLAKAIANGVKRFVDERREMASRF